MLIARDLRIDAGIRTLIGDVSFSVQTGDQIGLVGRNGTGKATLLRPLMGELHPADGTSGDSPRLLIGAFSIVVLFFLGAAEILPLRRDGGGREMSTPNFGLWLFLGIVFAPFYMMLAGSASACHASGVYR
ncbi:MAG TPA: ATP-binding cassette domain-containing protein [Acidimicrobiia bacterium]